MIGFGFASALSLAAALARDDFIASGRLSSSESDRALLGSTACQVLPSSNDRCKPPAELIAQRADSGTSEPEREKLLLAVAATSYGPARAFGTFAAGGCASLDLATSPSLFLASGGSDATDCPLTAKASRF